MRLFSDSLNDRQPIPERYAFAAKDPRQRTRPSQNLSPHLAWDGLPKGTRSLALIYHDSDAPSRPDGINRHERELPADLPRRNFYHWVLVDIAPTVNELREAEFSQGITPQGKKGPRAPRDMRQGLNDFTHWFSGDADMAGHYYGYDGPCPPWNDSIPHRYVLTLYALDTTRCPVDGVFTGNEVLRAIAGHTLDQASWQLSYSLNPRISP